MSEAPKSLDELKQTPFFQAGQRAKGSRIPLARAVSCLRFGCWQYDAFVAGYDYKEPMKAHPFPAERVRRTNLGE